MNNNSRRKKIDRQSLFVTVVVILMIAAVIIAIAVSLAKSKSIIEKTLETANKDEENILGSDPSLDTENSYLPSPETEDVFLNEDTDDSPAVSDKAEDTEGESVADSEAESDAVADTLPEFSAPVSGEIINEASLETPVFSLTMEDYRTHTGVDIYCLPGEDVAAVADGTVKEIWDDPMMGMCISVEHSGGAVSTYMGLCDTLPDGITVGKTVYKGQTIAAGGDTALLEIAEENHLHFELSIDGKTVDPCDYITFAASPVYGN